jgi:membrane protease YdiL (CAAX protease family)
LRTDYEGVSVPLTPIPWTPKDVMLGLLVWLTLFLVEVGALAASGRVAQWVSTFAAVVSEVGLVVPVWLLAVRKYRVSWRELGIRTFSRRWLPVGCLGLLVFYIFNIFYSLILFSFSLQVQPGLVPLMSDPSRAIPLALMAVLLAPTLEEIFFRGFAYAGFRERFGPLRAGVLSAGLFSVAHLTPTAVLPFFLLGLLFAYLYERSGSVWPSAIVHTAINVLGSAAAYYVANYS